MIKKLKIIQFIGSSEKLIRDVEIEIYLVYVLHLYCHFGTISNQSVTCCVGA